MGRLLLKILDAIVCAIVIVLTALGARSLSSASPFIEIGAGLLALWALSGYPSGTDRRSADVLLYRKYYHRNWGRIRQRGRASFIIRFSLRLIPPLTILLLLGTLALSPTREFAFANWSTALGLIVVVAAAATYWLGSREWVRHEARYVPDRGFSTG